MLDIWDTHLFFYTFVMNLCMAMRRGYGKRYQGKDNVYTYIWTEALEPSKMMDIQGSTVVKSRLGGTTRSYSVNRSK